MPSRSAASRRRWIWSRPWIVAWKPSLRDSVHLIGAAQLLGQDDREDLLGVDVELGAEAAADVGRDHADLVLGGRGDQRDHQPQDVGDLRRRVERHLAGRGDRVGDDAARFHRRGDEPLLQVLALDHDLGVGEGLLEGLLRRHREVEVEALVVAQVGVDEVGALGHGGLHVDDRRERLVVDLDVLERIGGLVAVAADHHRDAVADVARRVHRQRHVRRVLHVRRDRPGARQRAVLPLQVRAGERRDHAGLRERSGHVDARDARVRHGAAQHGHVEHAGQLHVVGPRRLARDQPRVLLAQHDPADGVAVAGVVEVGTLLDLLGDQTRVDLAHDPPPIAAAAACTALTMFW